MAIPRASFTDRPLLIVQAGGPDIAACVVFSSTVRASSYDEGGNEEIVVRKRKKSEGRGRGGRERNLHVVIFIPI